jgi:hypothetical protein
MTELELKQLEFRSRIIISEHWCIIWWEPSESLFHIVVMPSETEVTGETLDEAIQRAEESIV